MSSMSSPSSSSRTSAISRAGASTEVELVSRRSKAAPAKLAPLNSTVIRPGSAPRGARACSSRRGEIRRRGEGRRRLQSRQPPKASVSSGRIAGEGAPGTGRYGGGIVSSSVICCDGPSALMRTSGPTFRSASSPAGWYRTSDIDCLRFRRSSLAGDGSVRRRRARQRETPAALPACARQSGHRRATHIPDQHRQIASSRALDGLGDLDLRVNPARRVSIDGTTVDRTRAPPENHGVRDSPSSIVGAAELVVGHTKSSRS